MTPKHLNPDWGLKLQTEIGQYFGCNRPGFGCVGGNGQVGVRCTRDGF